MEYTRQNFKDGQVLTAEHMNKMDEKLASIPSFGGGMGDKLEWNGDRNTPSVGLGFDGSAIGTFYKVSDNIITREDLANGYSIAGYFSNGYFEYSTNGSDLNHIDEHDDGTLLVPTFDENGNTFNPMFVCCVPDGAVYESGVYFGAAFYNDGIVERVASITIPGYGKFPVTKPVAVEHLPAPLSFAETHSFSNTLAWNGSYEGLEVHPDPNQSEWYKLSDVVVTAEDLVNGIYAEIVTPGDPSCSPVHYGVNQGVFGLVTSNPSDIELHVTDENGNNFPALRFTNDGVFVTHCYSPVTNYETGGWIYFDNRVYSITIPGFNKFPSTVNRTIDKKYLPKAEVVYDLPEDFPVTGLEFNELLRALKNAGYLAK